MDAILAANAAAVREQLGHFLAAQVARKKADDDDDDAVAILMGDL